MLFALLLPLIISLCKPDNFFLSVVSVRAAAAAAAAAAPAAAVVVVAVAVVTLLLLTPAGSQTDRAAATVVGGPPGFGEPSRLLTAPGSRSMLAYIRQENLRT